MQENPGLLGSLFRDAQHDEADHDCQQGGREVIIVLPRAASWCKRGLGLAVKW